MEIMNIIEDGFFAAMAAIGFSTISHTPRRAFVVCALAAAIGHSFRMLMMQSGICGIVTASGVASFAVGVIAVTLSPKVKVPAESCLFPALLPMIPGMFAYRSVESAVGCFSSVGESDFMHWLYLLDFNLFTCCAVVLAMVLGANIPIFIWKRISFQATR